MYKRLHIASRNKFVPCLGVCPKVCKFGGSLTGQRSFSYFVVHTPCLGEEMQYKTFWGKYRKYLSIMSSISRVSNKLTLLTMIGCTGQDFSPPIQRDLETNSSSHTGTVTEQATPKIVLRDTIVPNRPLSLFAGTITPTKVLTEPLPALSITKPAISPDSLVQSSESKWETLRYMFPVQPPEVASYVNDHHTYPATDIFTPYRARYVAVTDGIIDELSRVDRWDPAVNDPATRGGLYVSLIGDDGIRYYGSHLDEVVEGLEPGDRVVVGQLLGFVGRSGNARHTPVHVHFGISYPTYPGDWQVRRGLIWPYRYLVAWTYGENLTPDLSSVLELE